MSSIGKSRWFELPVRGALDAMSFYEGLFGWTFLKLRPPAPDGYWVIEKDGELIGGLREARRPNEAKTGCDAPVIYITVAKLAASAARAKELGAELVGPAVELGQGRGAYQWFRDRERNLLALWAEEGA